MQQSSPVATSPPLLLSLREVAFELRLHKNTVAMLMRTGQLPFVAIGGRKMVARATLERFIQEREMRGQPTNVAVRNESLDGTR